MKKFLLSTFCLLACLQAAQAFQPKFGGGSPSVDWGSVTGKPAGFADNTDDTGASSGGTAIGISTNAGAAVPVSTVSFNGPPDAVLFTRDADSTTVTIVGGKAVALDVANSTSGLTTRANNLDSSTSAITARADAAAVSTTSLAGRASNLEVFKSTAETKLEAVISSAAAEAASQAAKNTEIAVATTGLVTGGAADVVGSYNIVYPTSIARGQTYEFTVVRSSQFQGDGNGPAIFSSTNGITMVHASFGGVGSTVTVYPASVTIVLNNGAGFYHITATGASVNGISLSTYSEKYGYERWISVQGVMFSSSDFVNDVSSPTAGQGIFDGSRSSETNFVRYKWNVPLNFDKNTDVLISSWIFALGGSDTGSHRYMAYISSFPDTAQGIRTVLLKNGVALQFAGDAAGANEKMAVVQNVTATGWKDYIQPGVTHWIYIARDGDDGTNDTSTTGSYSGELAIRYGKKQ